MSHVNKLKWGNVGGCVRTIHSYQSSVITVMRGFFLRLKSTALVVIAYSIFNWTNIHLTNIFIIALWKKKEQEPTKTDCRCDFKVKEKQSVYIGEALHQEIGVNQFCYLTSTLINLRYFFYYETFKDNQSHIISLYSYLLDRVLPLVFLPNFLVYSKEWIIHVGPQTHYFHRDPCEIKKMDEGRETP